MAVQAVQVRKSGFVERDMDGKHSYHPETHHSCTVYAGTVVQQVRFPVLTSLLPHALRLFVLLRNTLPLSTASRFT